MEIKLLNGRIDLANYNPSFIRNRSGNIVGVSLSIDSFYELTEDIEDYSFLEGRETRKEKTVSHLEVVSESGLTPEDLKEIRKRLVMTADQLGEQIGYSGGTIRNIETGQCKISKRFEKSVQELLDRSR